MLLRHIFAFLLFVFSTSSLVVFSTSSLADTIDVNFRDNSAQVQYRASMGRDTLGKAEFHMGLLYVDKNNLLGDFGILVRDDVGRNAPGISVGVGLKAVSGKAKNYDASALALGGLVRYSPFADSRFGIIGQFYFSPNIVTFGDADRYLETTARFEYEIIPQASVYLGYRKVKFGLEQRPDVTLEEGGHLGVRIMF